MEKIYEKVYIALDPLPLNIRYLEDIRKIFELYKCKNILYATNKFKKIKRLEDLNSHPYNQLKIECDLDRHGLDYFEVVFRKKDIVIFSRNRDGRAEEIAKDIKEYLESKIQKQSVEDSQVIDDEEKKQTIIINNNIESEIKTEKKSNYFLLVFEHPLIATVVGGIILLIIGNAFFKDNKKDIVELPINTSENIEFINEADDLFSKPVKTKEEIAHDLRMERIKIFIEKAKKEDIKEYTKYILEIKNKVNNTSKELIYLNNVYSIINEKGFLKEGVTLEEAIKKALEEDETIILKIQNDNIKK